MKPLFNKLALIATTVFVFIQFVQPPARNVNGQVSDKDISNMVPVPEDVQRILSKSCYDCHSNKTVYPWYARIQPGAWFVAYHIQNAKDKLNFSEFGAYSKRRQESKLDGIARQIEDGAMPVTSYLLMHRDAALSPSEKEAITLWVNSSKEIISSKN